MGVRRKFSRGDKLTFCIYISGC